MAIEPNARARRPPPVWVGDLVLVVIIAASAFVDFPGMVGDKTRFGYAVVIASALLTLLRRKWPFPVLVCAVILFCAGAFAFPITPISSLATAMTIYTIGTRRPPDIVIPLTAASLIPMAASVISSTGSWFDPAVFQVIVTLGFAGAVGDAVRVHRAYIAEITERARHAEETREAEASRRVAEDRLRIAQDLHDTVAHRISVISLNAGVATATIDKRPDEAQKALATIRSASREVLRDIGGLLSMLRSSDEEEVAPVPGLERLDELIGTFRSTGLDVTTRVEGTLNDLPVGVDVAAYRVLQEALTNAHKHGTQSRAHVWLHRDTDRLRIVVTNPMSLPPRASGEGSGHGLLGIRERVASVHGESRIGKDAHSFRVDVALPIPAENRSQPR